MLLADRQPADRHQHDLHGRLRRLALPAQHRARQAARDSNNAPAGGRRRARQPGRPARPARSSASPAATMSRSFRWEHVKMTRFNTIKRATLGTALAAALAAGLAAAAPGPAVGPARRRGRADQRRHPVGRHRPPGPPQRADHRPVRRQRRRSPTSRSARRARSTSSARRPASTTVYATDRARPGRLFGQRPGRPESRLGRRAARPRDARGRHPARRR